jgi:glyoxylase-like metal-dependent hydrolase (beta-lactamase superfamily II)
MADAVLNIAIEGVAQALRDARLAPGVETFFDEATNTATHVVWDRASATAAVIDSVLDYDPAAGRISTASADAVVAFLQSKGLQVDWLIETHVHADHLTAAHYLQSQVGGRTAISRRVSEVQRIFGAKFGLGEAGPKDGAGFDRLLDDGDRLGLGGLEILALATPGHTPADMTFVVGDTAFVGDTIFMPDWGTARTDFPGGDATALYRSVRRLLALPDATKLKLCHDYKPAGRDVYRWETTVGEERAGNVHLSDGVSEAAFVALRRARDAALPVPRLIYPSLQVNIRAGRLPDKEANGTRFLKIPLSGALTG